MTEPRFEQLVRRLETYAERHPLRYKLKVALVALAGYAYVLAVFGLAVGTSAWLVVLLMEGASGRAALVKLLAGLVVLSVIVLRSFWVRFDPPAGTGIHREQAPRLFLLIDKLTAALGTPPFHHVLIVNELNAGVTQVPRLGIFGWYRNYLLLGYPLMLAMTPAQFRAVLAHEFGHLGRHHSRFYSWIYRARMIWSRLLQELAARRHWGSVLFSKFVGWYAPFFNAYSFVLARAQEYEADRHAGHLVGPHSMKDALAALAVISRLLEESFWPALKRRAVDSPVPPASHLQEMARVFAAPPPSDQLRQWVTEALHRRTGYTNTHPSLADRFAALDRLPEKQTGIPRAVIPQLLGTGQTSAAEYYLGSHATVLREQLDRSWAEAAIEQWRQKHLDMIAARKRCQTLSDKSAGETLSPGELWEYACQLEVLEREQAAVPILRRLVTAQPTHASGNFALGRLLLAHGDQHGIPYLEAAMAIDREAVIPACQLVAQFLERTGRHDESLHYLSKADEQYAQACEAEDERNTVTPKDRFVPHGLPEDTIDGIERQLAPLQDIGTAYFLRKQVRLRPDVPCYVLLVIPRYRWYEWRHGEKDQALLGLLAQEVELPAGTYVYVVNHGEQRRWRRVLRDIPQAQLACSA